jgi:hypothetical protein
MGSRNRHHVVLAGLALALLACNLGQPAAPTAAILTSVPSEPAAPTPLPTAAPATETLVVTHVEPEFRLYAVDGTLVEARPAEGMSYPRPNTAQVVGDAIYYVASPGAMVGAVVRRVASDGIVDLEFTRSDEPGLAFAVSDDGSRIAWSHTSYLSGPPFSQLWTAAIDGSGATLVTQTETDDDIEEYFVLEPVEWLDDGDLVYAWQVTGIGGYILFFGWSSLYRYDVDAAATTPLVGVAPNVTAPCWSDVTRDGAFALGACGDDRAVVERAAATGSETVFPVLPEQGQAGAAVYAPQPGTLAYAIARSNPDDEAGQIVLVAGVGAPPAPIASQAPGAFGRLMWIDESRLAASYWLGLGPAESFVDLVGLDGSRIPLAAGELIGLMWR